MRILQSLMIALGLILCANRIEAGVVMSETEVHSGPGDSAKLSKKVYVQGKKQKVETPEAEVITDLEKGVVYVVDPTRKSYAEKPLPNLKSKTAAPSVNRLALKRNGKSRTIGGLACQEYQGTRRLPLMDVTTTVCMSKDSRIQEVAAFENQLLSELIGQRPASDGSEAFVPLQQTSTVKLRIPSALKETPSSESAVTTQMQVHKVEVKNLPASTFEPPAGFHKEPVHSDSQISV